MENFKAMGNMKRLETLCIAGAVAVLAVSCGKEGAVREDRASEVEFTASELQVKTVFGEKADGAYPVLWTSNERVVLFYNSQTGGQTGGGQYADVLPSADGHTAGFSASFTDDGSGSHSFYAMSPMSALNWMGNEDWDGGSYKKVLYANIPHDQTPVAGTCDEKAQIVFAKGEFTEFPDKVDLTFSHMTAYGLITSLSLPEEATEIVGVHIESNRILSGEIYYNYNSLDNTINHSTFLGEYDKDGKVIKKPKAFKYIYLDVNNGGLKAKKLENVFFACTPQTDGNDVFGEGDYLKFKVYTDTDTWVKTVNFSADRTLAFKAGRISSFSVSAHGFEKQ